MENNVVTLETAKKLKAAGFPQESLWIWVLPDEARPWLTIRDQIASSGKPYVRSWDAAPTAQELADQLPPVFTRTRKTTKTWYLDVCIFQDVDTNEAKGWVASYESISNSVGLLTVKGDDMVAFGPTMAEALALLWLKLHEALPSQKRVEGQKGTDATPTNDVKESQ